MNALLAPISPEERFARIRETVSRLRQPGCTGFGRVVLLRRLIDDLSHLEEIGALESVAEVLGVIYGGRV